MSTRKKIISAERLSVLEKTGYSLGDLSANLVFQTLITYLAYFYTDIYGMQPEDASVIMLFAGLTAAFVFNPLVGALADRTHSRWGKFRPWILFTSIPLGVAALLAFSTPDFSYKGKLLYAVATYTFLLLLYAANNLPYAALSGVITGDRKERNSLSSYRFIAVMFAQFFVQVFMLPIIEVAGQGNKAIGISKVMVVLSIIGSILLILTFLTTRERISSPPGQKTRLRQDIRDLLKNRPWCIMLLTTTLVFVALAMRGGSGIYYFENYVDKKNLYHFIQPILEPLSNIGLNVFGKDPVAAGFGLFNALGILFMITGILFSKKLADKYGKRNVYGCCLFIASLFLISFLFYPPQSVASIFAAQLLYGFFYGCTIPLLWAMIADVADYSEWKNNRRATGIIFSAMMVGLKAGLSLGGALLTFILNRYHYSSGNAIQLPEATRGILYLVSIFSALPFLVGVGLLFFYEIDKNKELEIETALKLKRNKQVL